MEISTDNKEKNLYISGQLSKKRPWAPLKILLTITGISLVIGLLGLVGRYLLSVRKNATATLGDNKFTLLINYSIFGKTIKETKTVTPIHQISAVTVENSTRYFHLIVGFGFLVIGLFSGVHWLLDGLGAGYPYLALIGAGIILASIAVDFVLFHFVPDATGRSNVIVGFQGINFRLLGVTPTDAQQFVDFVVDQFASAAQTPNQPDSQ